jgi:peptide-methionine (S)-S-oxide reductase
VDYDPEVLSYDDLLDAFWSAHDPRRPAQSVQYRSAILYRTEEERAAAESSKARIESSVGPVSTSIEPLTRFYRAESYHQKYRLRSCRDLMQEFRARFATDEEFVDSTAAARVNGWLDGYGSPDETASVGQKRSA